MAASLNLLTSSFISNKASTLFPQNPQSYGSNHSYHSSSIPRRPASVKIQAAKLPAGVELPKVQPKFQAPFLGFTKSAEIWNSRACMIGLIGTFIVELIINKGILQVIGVEVGKGLNLPL